MASVETVLKILMRRKTMCHNQPFMIYSSYVIVCVKLAKDTSSLSVFPDFATARPPAHPVLTHIVPVHMQSPLVPMISKCPGRELGRPHCSAHRYTKERMLSSPTRSKQRSIEPSILFPQQPIKEAHKHNRSLLLTIPNIPRNTRASLYGHHDEWPLIALSSMSLSNPLLKSPKLVAIATTAASSIV